MIRYPMFYRVGSLGYVILLWVFQVVVVVKLVKRDWIWGEVSRVFLENLALSIILGIWLATIVPVMCNFVAESS